VRRVRVQAGRRRRGHVGRGWHHFDWYNISHVDASNLPMQIVAAAMPKCRTLTCATSLLPGCPAVGQYKDPAGDVISCVSPMPNDPQSPGGRRVRVPLPDTSHRERADST
jgi:hypothetical protein